MGEKETLQSIVTAKGSAILTVSNSYSVDNAQIPDLKKLFKDAFPAYIETKESISYKLTPAFKKLLLDADYKHSKLIRNAALIKTSKTVKFEPLAVAEKVIKNRKVA